MPEVAMKVCAGCHERTPVDVERCRFCGGDPNAAVYRPQPSEQLPTVISYGEIPVYLAKLPANEIAVINAELASRSKSTGIAYLLLLLLGGIGAHHFYLERPVSGIFYILLFFSGFAFMFLPWGLLGLGLLIDLCDTPKRVKDLRANALERLAKSFGHQLTIK